MSTLPSVRHAKGKEMLTEQLPHLPDFTGTWVNTEMEGDVALFFQKGLELPWMGRKIMSAMNYGCGKLTHFLVMSKDRMEMSTALDMNGTRPEHMPPKEKIDGVVRMDASNKPIKMEWLLEPGQPSHIKLSPQYKDGASQSAFTMTRSMMPDGRMKTELTYPNKTSDIWMARIFERKK